MKETAVNTDTQRAHYHFEIKITEVEQEQEKKIVRDAFPFGCGHFHFRKWYSHWSQEASQCARRPRSPPSFTEIDGTNIHRAVSFTGVTSISKKTPKTQNTKRTTAHLKPTAVRMSVWRQNSQKRQPEQLKQNVSVTASAVVSRLHFHFWGSQSLEGKRLLKSVGRSWTCILYLSCK